MQSLPALVTAGPYTHMPTASLWHLQVIALIWTVSLCLGQAPALTYHCPLSPLHVSTLTHSLPSLDFAGTSTHKLTHSALCRHLYPHAHFCILPSVDICTYMSMAPWSLQTQELTGLLPLSGLYRKLWTHAHYNNLLSACSCTNMLISLFHMLQQPAIT